MPLVQIQIAPKGIKYKMIVSQSLIPKEVTQVFCGSSQQYCQSVSVYTFYTVKTFKILT